MNGRLKNFWNLRTKSLLVIGGVLVALTVALLFSTETILFNSFSKVEKQVAERNVGRVTDAIDDEMTSIANFTGDYSDWDDTVKFIKTGSKSYIDSNLSGTTYQNLDINHFAFLNKSGKLIYGQDYNLTDESFMTLSPILSSHFKTGDLLLQHKNHDDIKKGLMLLESGPVFVASRPSMDSNGEGPIEGSVITGRDFNQDRVDAVSSKTHLKVSIFLIGSQLPVDVDQAESDLTSGKPIVIRAANKNQVFGYKLLDDIYGHHALVLRVETPREIYQQGLVARNYLTVSLLGIGAVFLIMALVMLTRLYHRDQEVTELKDRFITIASHELRTPLTGIRGGAEMLSSLKLPAESKVSLKLIQDGADRLSHLTDELIYVATIEKGHFKAAHEPINLGDLASQVAYNFKNMATTKGLKLITDIGAIDKPFFGDGRLLRSAISNLLDNAIKFTEHGEVQLKVHSENDKVLIQVADTGPGIKEDATFMLFQKFSKVASVRESFKEGRGLGLYLTKLVAEAHGGEIKVDSSTSGTTFTISLPLGGSPRPPVAKPQLP